MQVGAIRRHRNSGCSMAIISAVRRHSITHFLTHKSRMKVVLCSFRFVNHPCTGWYSVRVSNSAGGVTSYPVWLNVNDPPVITLHPSSVSVIPRGTVSLNCSAGGTPVCLREFIPFITFSRSIIPGIMALKLYPRVAQRLCFSLFLRAPLEHMCVKSITRQAPHARIPPTCTSGLHQRLSPIPIQPRVNQLSVIREVLVVTRLEIRSQSIR